MNGILAAGRGKKGVGFLLDILPVLWYNTYRPVGIR